MIRSTWQSQLAGRFALGILGATLLASSLALAEGAGTPPAGGTPEAAAPKAQQTIFDFQKELALTDQQVADIKKLLGDLARTLKVTQAKITVLNYEVEELIKGEGDLKVIKDKLDEEGNLRAEARYADVTASRSINKVLSDSQLAAWKDLQAKERAKAAAAANDGK